MIQKDNWIQRELYYLVVRVLFTMCEQNLKKLVSRRIVQINKSNPGRWFRPPDPSGSCRKTPEIAGTWKQYSDRKLLEFSPLNSSQRTVLPDELAGNHKKNPKIFRPEYRFHKITGITRNRQFPGRVVRPGN